MRKLQTKHRVLLASLILAALLVSLSSLLVADAGTVGNIFVISLFIIVVPYFLYEYAEYIWLKSVERQFPNFIRDLADSKRSGMSLPESVHICSRTNYGKLTQEVKKMSNRLTWGTSFIRVMEIFNEQILRQPKVIALDFKELYYIDSSVMGTLVRFTTTAIRRRFELILYNLSTSVHSSFRLAGLGKFFKILDNKTFEKDYLGSCVAV